MYLLIVKVKLDNYGYNVLLALQGVSFTEVQEGLIVRREVSAIFWLTVDQFLGKTF